MFDKPTYERKLPTNPWKIRRKIGFGFNILNKNHLVRAVGFMQYKGNSKNAGKWHDFEI